MAPLEEYKLLVAPDLNVISEMFAKKLVAYVRWGGHLIVGPRGGMKDDNNALNPQRRPDCWSRPCAGAWSSYALDAPVPLVRGKADLWGELLSTSAPDAAVVLRYRAGMNGSKESLQ